MSLKFLVTGATGGLGRQVLEYFVLNLPASDYAAASSSATNRQHFESRGIAFRHANYDSIQSLETAFQGVENVLFVSTNTFDNVRRRQQHQNFVDAAKKAGVKHVWYTSLAFGGLKSESKAAVQQVHLMTEEMLRQSGLTFTSIREGAYTDAFPVFINWFPETKVVALPHDGLVAFTLRDELGEATARLMIAGGHKQDIVLLTAGETIRLSEIVDIINETTGRGVKFEIVSPEEYVQRHGANDPGRKTAAFFKAIAGWLEGIADGELETTHPLMGQVLGRQPKTPREAIREILQKDRDFTWHQNYVVDQ